MFGKKISLVSYTETVDAYGVTQRTEVLKERWARIKSVSSREFYQAQASGLKPAYIIILPHKSEYDGEKEVEYNGIRYSVEKTYELETCDEVELTVYGTR